MTDNTKVLLRTHLPDRLFATFQATASEAPKLTAADKLEMIEKLQLVELIFDSRRFDAFELVLTDDFAMDHALAKITSPSEFRHFWTTNEAMLLNGFRHQFNNIIVYPEADGTASAVSYLNVLRFAKTPDSSAPDTPHLVAHAPQVTHFRRENGIWKIDRITIDQMAVSQTFGLDEPTRQYFAALAGERDNIRQPLF